MAERGATPPVPRGRRMLLRAVRHLFKPLKPDDYLEMINPLWTTKELRGQVERVEARGSEAASVLIRPSYEWPGHQPGQYVRLGLVIDGRYHWRAYSLTSDPRPEDGLISVTPKKVDTGVVSPYLVEKIQPGELVRLGEIEGQFVLPEPLPAKLLFISAGSGITPLMSMARTLADEGTDIRTTRVGTAAADLILACDPLVAVNAETLENTGANDIRALNQVAPSLLCCH